MTPSENCSPAAGEPTPASRLTPNDISWRYLHDADFHARVLLVQRHLRLGHVVPRLFDVAAVLHAVDMLAQAEPAAPSITCPRCGRISYHPEDIKQRYCGACHGYHDRLLANWRAGQ